MANKESFEELYTLPGSIKLALLENYSKICSEHFKWSCK